MPASDPAASGDSPSYLRKSKPTPEPQSQVAQKGDPNLLRVSVALGLVLALGVVALYAKRKKSGLASLRNQIRMHSLASLPMGPKSKVALLSVGREALLLGITEQGITCLRCYPEDELWSLTSALPGFGDMIREQEEQAKLAQRPRADRSVMDRAFSDLLIKAGHDAGKKRSATPGASFTGPVADEFVPSEVQAGTFGKLRAEPQLDDLPPHLVALLAETEQVSTAKPAASKSVSRANVVQLHPAAPDAFESPDGQAAELARRFSELSS